MNGIATVHDETNYVLTRRQLLQSAGAVIVTFSLSRAFRGSALAQSATAQRELDESQVDSWLAVASDGRVTVYCGKVELGTGIRTALAQIVAEELDVPFERVEMIMGDTATTPDQGYTAGSKSIQVAGPVLQRAAAEARAVLVARASDRLGEPVTRLTVRDGVVSVVNDASKSVSYGELAGSGFDRSFTVGEDGGVSGTAPLKDPKDYTIVGKSFARVDIPPKVTGQPSYVQDVRIDGMLHGRIVRPPLRTFTGVGAVVESVDESSVADVPGLVQVVRNGNFIGVVAEREEQAIEAARKLKVTWRLTETLPEHENLYEYLRTLPVSEEETVADAGDVETALASAARTLEATYLWPFQAHASMGPSCAVADVRPDSVQIWSSTQGVYPLRGAIAQLLGRDEETVRVIHVEGAGCYGHNGFDDVAADAALLSQAVGRPVRVQWMREDEFAYEPKGPAMVIDLRGGLDESGNVVAWDYTVLTPGHSTRPGGQAGNLLAGQLIDPPAPEPPIRHGGGNRNALHLYAFPNNRIITRWLDSTVLRQSALRSLGGMANTTAVECFLDELAAAAGADPIEFRLRYLTDPRAIDVVKKVAEASGWDTRPAGAASNGSVARGRGVAFSRYESEFTYVAVVAEVEVDRSTGRVRVDRVVVAHDCGRIINPDGLTNQIEGNVIQGVSRALKEEITWNAEGLTSLDWESYPILTFPEVPTVEVALIDRPELPPLGAGEPAHCNIAAAIGNAIFDATGARLRTVPFTPERVKAALG